MNFRLSSRGDMMVKTTKRHFRLEPGEYIITPDHPDAIKYRILYEQEDITDEITAIVRININENRRGRQ